MEESKKVDLMWEQSITKMAVMFIFGVFAFDFALFLVSVK